MEQETLMRAHQEGVRASRENVWSSEKKPYSIQKGGGERESIKREGGGFKERERETLEGC